MTIRPEHKKLMDEIIQSVDLENYSKKEKTLINRINKDFETHILKKRAKLYLKIYKSLDTFSEEEKQDYQFCLNIMTAVLKDVRLYAYYRSVR
jgi:hypothetical protein